MNGGVKHLLQPIASYEGGVWRVLLLLLFTCGGCESNVPRLLGQRGGGVCAKSTKYSRQVKLFT
jgi:hypothetical protein